MTPLAATEPFPAPNGMPFDKGLAAEFADRSQNAGKRSGCYRLDIVRVGFSTRGEIYDGYHAGERIVESSRNPFFDGARVFHGAGVTGRLEMWRPDTAYPSMTGTIERCAKWTISETDAQGLRLVRWKPFDPAQRAGMAIAGVAGSRQRPFEDAPQVSIATAHCSPFTA